MELNRWRTSALDPKAYSVDRAPYRLVSGVLNPICRVPTDVQFLRIASDLRECAINVNEDAEGDAEQRFALDVASLAALADGGPDGASEVIRAGAPR